MEPPCEECDDTAMNGIELQCHNSHDTYFGGITSSVGPWGEWTTALSCQSQYFISSFRMDTQPPRPSGDDTAVNNVNVMCRQPSSSQPTTELDGNSPAPWGSRQYWSSSCPLGSAVCGLRTKVELPQGEGDDTALNDIQMYCYEYTANARNEASNTVKNNSIKMIITDIC